MGEDWSKAEVNLIVADYFDMLTSELQGHPYSKSNHRAALMPALQDRSKGSVEFKHQNISAVLINMGLPYIDGYKPRGNFQRLLADAVGEYLASRLGLLDEFAASPRLNPDAVPVLTAGDSSRLFEDPPDHIVVPHEDSKPWLTRRVRVTDFALRDTENRRLGKLGEQFTVSLEQSRLKEAGRDDLASKVEWVAETVGDGLGYDVLSFDEKTGSERLVEVKTTTLGKYFPFYVTRNEVRCSEDMHSQFRLYRVFDFGKTARLYQLHGALSSACHLQPVLYRAAIGS